MIERLQGFPDNVLAFVCKGRITRQDYDTVLVPAVEDALRRHDKLRLYYETAGDFAAYDAGAMWDDFKVGVEHLTRWERFAVVSDVEWIRHSVQLFGFLMPAKMRMFSTSETTAARDWIVAP
ncbi:MAG: STAS/SEC14 domain-containing protein [Proteobacteria bacterium]|nr:STAS/SEC14 domain-containing protein [Pseudomonadota bacterium]